MAINSVHVSGVLQQTADIKDGELPKFSVHMDQPLTLKADDGTTVTSSDIQLEGGDYYQDALLPLANSKKVVSLDVPVSANHHPGFDMSPESTDLSASITQKVVEDWSGQPFQPPFS